MRPCGRSELGAAALALPVLALALMIATQWQRQGLSAAEGVQMARATLVFAAPILLGAAIGITTARLRRSPPPASTAKDACGWWSRPSRSLILGVRPKSPRHSTTAPRTSADAAPRRILGLGGRFVHQDAADTPNTQLAIYDYAPAPVIYEGRALSAKPGMAMMDQVNGTRVGVVAHCEGGYVSGLVGCAAYDPNGKLIEKFGGDWTKPENLVVNGPYKAAEWRKGDFLRSVKNDKWEGADKLCFSEVVYFPVSNHDQKSPLHFGAFLSPYAYVADAHSPKPITTTGGARKSRARSASLTTMAQAPSLSRLQSSSRNGSEIIRDPW